MSEGSRRVSRWSAHLFVGLAVLAWLLTFTLRVSDVVTDRHQSMGIYVSPVANGVLRVDGHRSGQERFNGLRIGDRIVRVGGHPPPGGQLAFQAAFLDAQGRLTIEREGRVLEVESPLEERAGGAIALVTTFFLGVLGILIGVLGKPKHGTWRPAVLALLGGITTGASPNGPSPETVALCTYLQVVASLLIGPVATNWIQRFVRPEANAGQLLWPWGFAAMGVAVYSVYLGRPIPPPYATWVTAAIPTLICLAFAAIVVQHYPRLGQDKRTQLNWLITGAGTYAIFNVGLFLLSSAFDAPFLYTVGQSHLWVLIAVAFGMAILKADFGRIDRAASLAVTYAVLVVTLALFVEFVAEPMAGFAAANLGLPESIGQAILVVTFALGGPALKRKMEPRLRGYFAPLRPEGSSLTPSNTRASAAR